MADLAISVVNVHGEERAFAKGYAVFCTQMWTEDNLSWVIPPVTLKPP